MQCKFYQSLSPAWLPISLPALGMGYLNCHVKPRVLPMHEIRHVDKLVQPCARLGHRCDYNPRLSFKDDTPRVVEKMQHLTGQSKGVWDRFLSRLYDSQLAKHPRHDFLPPFSRLTNDEDREKKAEFRPPGSYNVIVTPSSLAQLEEYKANQDEDKTPISAVSERPQTVSTNPLCQNIETNVIVLTDPDTVMLRVFEDNTKKLISPTSPSSRFGVSSTSSLTSPSPNHYFQRTDMFSISSQHSPPPSTFEITPQDPCDWPLICHYRNLLSRHLFHVHRGSITPPLAPGAFFTQELFERTVATFPPVSLSCSDGALRFGNRTPQWYPESRLVTTLPTSASVPTKDPT
ncbi:MAG: hypothetical protein Q9224_000606 [Gallowayella concinna]